MIYTQKIHTDFQIKTLEDLEKLKPFLEDGTLKVNKSQIARELGKDRRCTLVNDVRPNSEKRKRSNDIIRIYSF